MLHTLFSMQINYAASSFREDRQINDEQNRTTALMNNGLAFEFE